MEKEFSVDSGKSLEKIFGINEEGLRGRFLGYVRVLYRAFQGGEI